MSSPPNPEPPPGPGRAPLLAADVLLVLAFGGILLAALLLSDPPKLAWSDELIYALVGRHIADGLGNVSSITHPLTLAARGPAQPDVHLPGHMYLIAAAFELFGRREAAALAPSVALFLAAGLLLYVAGARSFGREAGLLAAALFYVAPPNLAYANSALMESTLQCAAAAYLAVWLEALARPSHRTLVGLGILLGLGAFCRETFLVFTPSALWLLRDWPRGARWRASVALLAPLAAILAVLVAPAYLAKAPYPHAASELVGAGSSSDLWEILLTNTQTNLRQSPFLGQAAWQCCGMLGIAALLLSLFRRLRAQGSARALAGLGLFAVACTWLPLLPLYRMPEWTGVRVLMAASVPLLLTVAVWLASLQQARVRTLAIGVALLLCASATAYATSELGRDRAKASEEGGRLSDYLRRLTPAWQPRLVMAPKAYRYAWDAYPVTVIPWDTTLPRMQRLAAIYGPVDLFVIRGGRELERFTMAAERGAFGVPYRPLGRPLDGFYYAFVRKGAERNAR